MPLSLPQVKPDVVVHAGGVIRDALLAQQTLAAFREVVAPKHYAALRLADLLWAQPAAAEISFSSLSALLGTAGQANYAAANQLLNVQAELRQSQGRPCSAVSRKLAPRLADVIVQSQKVFLRVGQIAIKQ